jgi:two-component system chemotaxis sensor kinase CheA
MDPMTAIRNTFFQECEEQLAALEGGLLMLQGGDCDPETVNAVFRAVHSVKGGAGAFGLNALVRFAHVFETALDDVRAGRLAPDPRVLRVMLRAADALADLVRAARDGGAADAERDRLLAEDLKALSGNHEPQASELDVEPGGASDSDLDGFAFQPLRFDLDAPPAPAEQAWTVRFRPGAELYAKANEAAVLLRELGRLGSVAVTLDASALPPLPDLDPEGAYLAWTIDLATTQPESAIREVFEFVEGDCELDIALAAALPGAAGGSGGIDLAALIQQSQATVMAAPAVATPEPGRTPYPADAPAVPTAASKATIRVDLDRIDRLIDLVGELVINQAMLAQRVSEAGLSRSSNVALGLGDLEQLTREIQDSVMAIRAQPVKLVFQRMPRLVREVSALTGKPVHLVTEGEGTEVDKTVIEHLADPLTHMIRNAIDHGLERPEDRAAAGKPADGTVRLAARHRSGRIVIEVSDDGGGINRPRVRASAAAKGLIASDAVLSDEETDNLIFLPGFSTAEMVSDISGRGVGMDVVKRSIQALGGRIAIASRPGQGSTFTMSLPLTLAVLDGMAVSVGGQTLVVPLTAIVETLQPRTGDVHSLGGAAALIAIRGTFIPVVDVGVALGYRAEPLDPARGVALLIEGDGGARAALLVDAIQGQRQVVIKSLEANYRRVPGVAAATILGDGRVALILDVDAIVAASRSSAGQVPEFTPAAGFAHA